MNLYLDTSALVKLFINEHGHDLVGSGVNAATSVTTSVIAYTECRAAFARRQRAGDLDLSQLALLVERLDAMWPGIARFPVSELIAQRAGGVAEIHRLRGFDAIHLATALHANQAVGNVHFLAFDNRLNDAARIAGLAVFDASSADELP